MARKAFNPDLIQTSPDQDVHTSTKSPLTVSQVTALVKRAIETALPPTIHVVGEISNYKRHSSGHLYFTLKDRSSELSCVMWRSSAESLKFAPTDGLEVIATGSVEVFERAGRYQLYIRRLQPRGIGALELAFRQLCDKLRNEDLFNEAHKKRLPACPTRIAVVTSPTGAAITDILRTITRRYPCIQVLIYPVRVQAEGAAREIAHAIRRINANEKALGGVDLMIVGRGGGSLEDLWAFNEEIVARAIYGSRIPIISAVGHEVDITIADLVADVRAATPTAAAELAVPILEDIFAEIEDYTSRLYRALCGRAQLATERLSVILHRRPFREPLDLVHRREQILDELEHLMYRGLFERVHKGRLTLGRLEPIIQRIAPHALLLHRAIELGNVGHRLDRAISRRWADTQQKLTKSSRQLDHTSPEMRVPRLKDRLDRLAQTLATSIRHRLSLCIEHVRRDEECLWAMSHRSVLSRGFSITRTKRGTRVVRSIGQLRDRQRLVTEVADGKFESEVVNLRQLELFE